MGFQWSNLEIKHIKPISGLYFCYSSQDCESGLDEFGWDPMVDEYLEARICNDESCSNVSERSHTSALCLKMNASDANS